MNRQSMESFSEELAESARKLLAATSDAAEGAVRQAREQLEATLENGSAVFDEARNCASKGLCAMNSVARENPYALAGAAFALGLVIAFVVKPCRK